MIAATLVVVLSAFFVITGFVFVFSFKRLLDLGITAFWYIRVVAYVWLVVGGIADVLFNWIWGSIIYREFPKEWTFTARTRRHFYRVSGWRKAKAERWAVLLNAVDPNHI